MTKNTTETRPAALIALLLALVPPCAALIPSALQASTIAVNTTGDPGADGTCDLRDAMVNANNEDQSGSTNCAAGSGNDTIVFSVSGTITLGNDGTLPPVMNTLTIDGSGQTITLDGASLYGVLQVNGSSLSTLNLNNLTIANGMATDGGGVSNGVGNLNVTNCTFSGNNAAYGGGILNQDGFATVTNSTFSDNTASVGGGGINNSGGVLSVTYCTFWGNSADYGGGIFPGGTTTVNYSLLAHSTSGGNCGDGIGGNYNISDDHSCGFSGTGANHKPIGDGVSDAHIALGPLANNGGPTETFALGSGSYAINAIPSAECPSTDQRSAPRPGAGKLSDDACDIGAFESGNQAWVTPTAINFGTVTIGESSAASLVTLYNGPGKNLSIEWAIQPDFEIVSTTCPAAPTILAPGQYCNFELAFKPIFGGSKNERFQIHDDAPGNPQTVHLRGVAKGSR